MCQFFSCVSDGDGEIMYFDAAMRKRIMDGETEYQDTDSHTSIAHANGYRSRDEDVLNKYEYNPLTGTFTIDQLNTTDDSAQVHAFCEKLDWSTVVPELIIKPIVHPFKIEPRLDDEAIELLQRWASVRVSVWVYIGSFFTLEQWQYIDHEPGQCPFQPAVDLWERGLVPSYNGKTWRLHGGPGGSVLYEM